MGAGLKHRPRELAVAPATVASHVPSAAAAGPRPLSAGAQHRLLSGAGLRFAAGCLPQVRGGAAGGAEVAL